MLPDLFIYYSHMEKEIEKKPPEFPITSNSKYLYFMYIFTLKPIYCGRMMTLVIMLSYTGILRPAGRKALCVFCNVESVLF